MEKEIIKIPGKDVFDILNNESDEYQLIKKKFWYDERDKLFFKSVIKRESDGKFFKGTLVGATSYAEPEDVNGAYRKMTECHPVEKTITVTVYK